MSPELHLIPKLGSANFIFVKGQIVNSLDFAKQKAK